MLLTIPAVIWAATILAWVSAVILIRAAHGAHIGALTERAIAAVAIAIFGTVYSLVVLDAEVLGVLTAADAVMVRRAAVLVLLAVPIWWMVLYLTGRLGDDGKDGPA